MFFFQKGKLKIMGILNVTPDSFSDGGRFNNVESALVHAERMIEAGAAIIDIGAQSTRPGYVEVTAEEEERRILPVVRAIRRQFPEIPLSIDTYFAKVARKTLDCGAKIINDIHGFAEEEMFQVLKEFPESGAIIMHNFPQKNCPLTEEIKNFYTMRLKQCSAHKISLNRICLDPGIGWKNEKDTLDILRNLQNYGSKKIPILIGVSRKRIIKTLTGESDVNKRDLGTIVTALFLANTKQVDILRVHDVKGMQQAIRVWEQLKNCQFFDDSAFQNT